MSLAASVALKIERFRPSSGKDLSGIGISNVLDVVMRATVRVLADFHRSAPLAVEHYARCTCHGIPSSLVLRAVLSLFGFDPLSKWS